MSLSLAMVLLAVLLALVAFLLASSIVPLMSSRDKEELRTGTLALCDRTNWLNYLY